MLCRVAAIRTLYMYLLHTGIALCMCMGATGFAWSPAKPQTMQSTFSYDKDFLQVVAWGVVYRWRGHARGCARAWEGKCTA